MLPQKRFKVQFLHHEIPVATELLCLYTSGVVLCFWRFAEWIAIFLDEKTKGFRMRLFSRQGGMFQRAMIFCGLLLAVLWGGLESATASNCLPPSSKTKTADELPSVSEILKQQQSRHKLSDFMGADLIVVGRWKKIETDKRLASFHKKHRSKQFENDCFVIEETLKGKCATKEVMVPRLINQGYRLSPKRFKPVNQSRFVLFLRLRPHFPGRAFTTDGLFYIGKIADKTGVFSYYKEERFLSMWMNTRIQRKPHHPLPPMCSLRATPLFPTLAALKKELPLAMVQFKKQQAIVHKKKLALLKKFLQEDVNTFAFRKPGNQGQNPSDKFFHELQELISVGDAEIQKQIYNKVLTHAEFGKQQKTILYHLQKWIEKKGPPKTAQILQDSAKKYNDPDSIIGMGRLGGIYSLQYFQQKLQSGHCDWTVREGVLRFYQEGIWGKYVKTGRHFGEYGRQQIRKMACQAIDQRIAAGKKVSDEQLINETVILVCLRHADAFACLKRLTADEKKKKSCAKSTIEAMQRFTKNLAAYEGSCNGRNIWRRKDTLKHRQKAFGEGNTCWPY